MKAILTFNLEDSHDKELFNLHNHAKDLYSILRNIDEKLRDEAKYKNNKLALQIREDICSIMNEYHFSLDILS